MLYVHVPEQAEHWRALLQAALPEITVLAAPAEVDPLAVRYLACWRPPAGLFARFPDLRAVFALGAGVDRFVTRPDLAPAVALVRLSDAGMARQMIEYVRIGLLRFQRRIDDYAAQQARGLWQPLPARAAEEMRVTVLGLGALGAAVAQALAADGYVVRGWSRSAHQLAAVDCRHGEAALDALLADSDALVMLLPNTDATRGLLDARRLALLPAGAIVINAGRGEQLDLDALLAGLQAGRLGGAQLDVFAEEPLPATHPAWQTPRLYLSPHVAAMTLPGPSVQQLAVALRALEAGQPPLGLVDRQRGY